MTSHGIWDLVDLQAGPCMGQCMGGAWIGAWCMGGVGCDAGCSDVHAYTDLSLRQINGNDRLKGTFCPGSLITPSLVL